MYSEKATKFCKVSTLLVTVCAVVKIKVEISQNFVAFSEYINFNKLKKYCITKIVAKFSKKLQIAKKVFRNH